MTVFVQVSFSLLDGIQMTYIFNPGGLPFAELGLYLQL